MKKLIISIIVALFVVVIYVTASWYIGNIIRSNIENKVELFTQQINDYQNEFKISIHYRDYQQNVFSSNLHLVINILNKDDNDINLFDDKITIHHGPFPLAALSAGEFIPQIAWVNYALSQEISSELSNIVGNQPLVTGSLGISFTQYITLKLVNAEINDLSEPFRIKDYNININQLHVSRGELVLKNNKDFNQFSLDLKLDQLQFLIGSESVSLDNTKLSIIENKENTGFVYALAIGDFLYQLENQEETPKVTMNTIEFTGNIYRNQLYDLNFVVDELAYFPDTDAVPFLINKFIINQKNSSSNQNTIFNGELISSIKSLQYGQQNLGYGDIQLRYNELLEEDNALNDKPIIFLSLDKLSWYNRIGQMNASANVDLFNHYLDMDKINIDSIDRLKININIPFDVLSQMAAQIDNPQTTEVTAGQLNDMNQSMQLLAMILSRPIPIFTFTKGDIEGVYADLNYSKNNNYVEINGQMVDKNSFLALFY